MPAPGGNCTIRALQRIEAHPEKLALWSSRSGIVSFRNMGERASVQQGTAESLGLTAGDVVLVMAMPGPDLYATLLALMGLGIGIVFIEPWMPAKHIERAVDLIRVKAIFADTFGRFWSLRISALKEMRIIPISFNSERLGDASKLRVVNVQPELPAIISFTTGTTGAPKGVVRTHAYLWDLHEILVKYGDDENFTAPDLTIFPNLALFHLGTGRGSLLVPPNWSPTTLHRIKGLDKNYWPQSLSCGPAFLKHLLDHDFAFQSLRSVNVGGALVECDLFERALKALPRTQVRQIYGGTEVEPISFVDARVSVERSRQKGFTHALNIGHPISELETRFDANGTLWVAGRNVCPEYLGNPEENAEHKRRDESGVLWHCTGDRVIADESGFWYMGRKDQSLEDFLSEQKLYAKIGHTRAFVRRDRLGEALIIADDDARNVDAAAREVMGQKVLVWTSLIYRDRRHKSRIDRQLTWERGLRMLRWWTFIKERSPLPVLIILASGPIVSGFIFTLVSPVCAASLNQLCVRASDKWIVALFAIFASVLFMIEARLMDELKDFEKDKLANPARPLPRGLISPSELATAVKIVMAALFILAVLILVVGNPLSGFLFAGSAAYLWLMYKEFYVGQILSSYPLIYALSHQIVGVSLYLFGVTLFAEAFAKNSAAWSYVLINVLASISYEFSRKLKPDAHPAALTYRQFYGLGKASLIALFFQLAALTITAFSTGEIKSIGLLLLFQIPTCVVISLHALRDGWHKQSEGLAALSLLASGWMGLLLLLKF